MEWPKVQKGQFAMAKILIFFFVCFPRYGSSQVMAYTMFLISKETELPKKWNKLQKITDVICWLR